MSDREPSQHHEGTKDALVGSGGEQRADVFQAPPVDPVPIEMITSAPGPLMSAPSEPAGGGSPAGAPSAPPPHASSGD